MSEDQKINDEVGLEAELSGQGQDLDLPSDDREAIVDFDQNGLLLKIATDGISVQDYVKRLKESDILVAVDGEIYRDGPAKLNEKFIMEAGDEAKWLLTWRDGELFDIMLNAPIQSQFGLATEQETEWALSNFLAMFTMNSQLMRTLKFIETGMVYVTYLVWKKTRLALFYQFCGA